MGLILWNNVRSNQPPTEYEPALSCDNHEDDAESMHEVQNVTSSNKMFHQLLWDWG